MASSSSSSSSFQITTSEKYSVFLSFRGVDAEENYFATNLRTALHRQNIKTFCTDHDNIPEKGEMTLSPPSFKAIKDSKLAIIIFSKSYASSPRCLEELTHILEFKGKTGHVVVPIFYNLDPLDVQKQQGSYTTWFSLHEERFKNRKDKMQQWRNVLTHAANLPGWITREHRSESKLVEEIVRDIKRILNRTLISSDFKGLVGIEKRIEEMNKLLCIGSHDIRIVGIWGMAGIGKTTLAAAVYNKLSSHFEDSYFLADVRESSKRSGLASLQRMLIFELFSEKEDTSVDDTTIGKEMQKKKRVLLVLDDVDDWNQFERLAREQFDWFSVGSRIIVTSRDAQVLRNIAADAVYKVEELNDDEALQLFHLKAFRSNFPTTDYLQESKRVVEYSKGLPLAIKTLGSYLHSKRKSEWESAINKLRKVPNMDVQETLRTSYDSLSYKVKSTFLDIACFFKGEDREFVEQILGYGSYTKSIIDRLIDNSLVTIQNNKQLWMHDLVQQMGWEIVQQESIAKPWKRSRLWSYDDVYHVLQANKGTAATEGIFLKTSDINEEIKLSPIVFQEMHNLRLLKISSYDDYTKKWNVHFPQGLQTLPSSLKYLHWDGCPLKCLPFKFTPDHLAGLIITNSHINDLPWHGVQYLRCLRFLDLSHSKQLIIIPYNFHHQAPNLECLCLQFCTSLAQVPLSFRYLDNLRILNLRGCSMIKDFPMLPRNLRNLDLSWTPIRQMPSADGHLCYLETLNLKKCEKLEFLPESISSWNSLKELNICCCTKLTYLPKLPLYLENLNAKGCTLLETVPKSRIALAQGQDDSLQHSSGRFDFFNCLKLDDNARMNIIVEAQLRLLKMATSSLKDKEGGMSETWCPGNDIPKWISYQYESSSAEIKLPPDWCSTNFLGFALGGVVDFKKIYIDENFKFYFRFSLSMDSQPHGVANDTLIFNWDPEGSDHDIIVDSEHVFLFNYCNKNSFTGKYDNNFSAASFKFYSNRSDCTVKRCGVHFLYAEDVEKILSLTQHVGKLVKVEDAVFKVDFKDVGLSEDPEASGGLDVQGTCAEKEEDHVEQRFHDIAGYTGKSLDIELIEEKEEEEDRLSFFEDGITQDIGKSSKIEEDFISDHEYGTFTVKPESSGDLDAHEVHTKKEEDGDSNPVNYKIESTTYSCSCLMFLSLAVDIFKHVLGRQFGSGKNPKCETRQLKPDKVLHNIMMELGEHNKRISQHLQTVMPASHISFDSPKAASTSIALLPHSAAVEKNLHDIPDEIIDSLCSQIIRVRDQNNKILRNLRTLVPTTLVPELASSSSTSSINDKFQDEIAGEQHVKVPEEVIISLQSHLTKLHDDNQQVLQYLCTKKSNPPTTTNKSEEVERFTMTSGMFHLARSEEVERFTSGTFHLARSEDCGTKSYVLEACFLCRKPLKHNTDIFMYRGEQFCSEECRQEQIACDEATGSSSSLGKSHSNKNSTPSTTSQTGTSMLDHEQKILYLLS